MKRTPAPWRLKAAEKLNTRATEPTSSPIVPYRGVETPTEKLITLGWINSNGDSLPWRYWQSERHF